MESFKEEIKHNGKITKCSRETSILGLAQCNEEHATRPLNDWFSF